MPALFIPGAYLAWHYGESWREAAAIGYNFLRFVYHFFSLPETARHLFAPWRRLAERYPSGFQPADFFSTLIVNLLMRLIGFFFRLGLLAVGSAALVVTAALGLLFWCLWLLAPVLLVGLALVSVYLLFS